MLSTLIADLQFEAVRCHRRKEEPLLRKFALRRGNTMAKKRRKLRGWTKDDVRELKTLAKQKTPLRKIARSLKRTEAATRQKASALGVSLDTRG
jgi:hypothetical protein